jgi:hypothetical protein
MFVYIKNLITLIGLFVHHLHKACLYYLLKTFLFLNYTAAN